MNGPVSLIQFSKVAPKAQSPSVQLPSLDMNAASASSEAGLFEPGTHFFEPEGRFSEPEGRFAEPEGRFSDDADSLQRA